jgi:magnesium transporter
MTTLRIYNPATGFHVSQGIDGLAEALKDDANVIWIALDPPTPDELTALKMLLELHDLVMEDLTGDEDRPRYRKYADVTSLVLFGIRTPSSTEMQIEFPVCRVVFNNQIVVTVTDEPTAELEEAYIRWKNCAAGFDPDTEAPVYALLDTITDSFFPVVDRVVEAVDELEDQVVDDGDPSIRNRVFSLKRSILHFRRTTAGTRDVVGLLLRHDETALDRDSIYLRDVYDHLSRITDSLDIYRDLLSNVMDAYLSVISNRLANSSNELNATMQRLTVWGIVLGSGTLISGLYGMNVQKLPLSHVRHEFFVILGIIVIIGATLMAWFHRKGWA